jgi:VIT1/CCC1 family predicted Fe2+/Mn2+ transporter
MQLLLKLIVSAIGVIIISLLIGCFFSVVDGNYFAKQPINSLVMGMVFATVSYILIDGLKELWKNN